MQPHHLHSLIHATDLDCDYTKVYVIFEKNSRVWNAVWLSIDKKTVCCCCCCCGRQIDFAGGVGDVDDLSGASSNASSLTSVPGASNSGGGQLYPTADRWGRRRSSTWTGRYSDTTDPEFANLRFMTGRGSVGMHSLSDSLHRLTFTQSLAFPELARKLANRRRQEQLRATVNETSQDDFEACSKFVAVAGVFLLSVMVYGVVNKYAKVWNWAPRGPGPIVLDNRTAVAAVTAPYSDGGIDRVTTPPMTTLTITMPAYQDDRYRYRTEGTVRVRRRRGRRMRHNSAYATDSTITHQYQQERERDREQQRRDFNEFPDDNR